MAHTDSGMCVLIGRQALGLIGARVSGLVEFPPFVTDTLISSIKDLFLKRVLFFNLIRHSHNFCKNQRNNGGCPVKSQNSSTDWKNEGF